ncbi:MAG: mechanosensitive ion channel family protein [Phormidesmis sp.]
MLLAAAIAFLPLSTQAQTPDQPSTTQSPAPTAAPTTTSAEARSAASRLLPVWPLTNPATSPADTEGDSSAPIYLDGRTVFYLSAPPVDGPVDGPQPAETRAKEIQQRLNQAARQQLTQDQTVSVETDQPSQLPVIFVDDLPLLTVTSLDAANSGYADPGLYAIALQANIETALGRYYQERQPTFLKQQARIAIAIIGVALLLFWFSKRIEHFLKLRQTRLASTNTQLGQATGNTRPPLRAFSVAETVDSVFDLLKARLDNRQKRKITELELGVLRLFRPGLALGSLLWILSLFPYSRWITTLLGYWIEIPAQMLLIAGVGYLMLRLVSLVADKTFLALQEGAHWAPEASERLSLRLLTFSQVTKGIAAAVIFGIVILTMLSTAGIQVGPLLAGAGIIGVGISLAAQSLIKDIINGFLILLEDQFGIGDVIAVGEIAGSVEALNLRITQLRDTEGRLITIPNSQIGIVQNLSKDWSQVDLFISVEPSSDLNEALSILKTTATDMAEDSDWQQLILEPPDLLGVESIDSTGVTLRLLLKTQPLKQWPVARELRARIKHAFDQAGISTGVPQEKLAIHWEGQTRDSIVQELGDQLGDQLGERFSEQKN